jgi:hypothetical protein
MLPAYRYNIARWRADLHVQVRLERVAVDAQTPGDVPVAACVVHVFRGPQTVRIGDPLEFSVSAARHGDALPIGGALWTNLDVLRAGRFMEAYFDGQPPNCSVALWQCQVIDAPSDAPVLPCHPAGSVEDAVHMLAAGCFAGGPVRARLVGTCGVEERFEAAVRAVRAMEVERDRTTEAAGHSEFRVGDFTLRVGKDAGGVDLTGPPAAVLPVLMAAESAEPDVQPRGPGSPTPRSLVYADLLSQAGEDHGALVMFDAAIDDLDRLARQGDRPGLSDTLARALVAKGAVVSQSGGVVAADELFRKANDIALPRGEEPNPNAGFRWVTVYLDRANDELVAGRDRSAEGLFRQAVGLLDLLVNRRGRDNLAGELAKARVNLAAAQCRLGRLSGSLE